jgi:gas vesicle protein
MRDLLLILTGAAAGAATALLLSDQELREKARRLVHKLAGPTEDLAAAVAAASQSVPTPQE